MTWGASAGPSASRASHDAAAAWLAEHDAARIEAERETKREAQRQAESPGIVARRKFLKMRQRLARALKV